MVAQFQGRSKRKLEITDQGMSSIGCTIEESIVEFISCNIGFDSMIHAQSFLCKYRSACCNLFVILNETNMLLFVIFVSPIIN